MKAVDSPYSDGWSRAGAYLLMRRYLQFAVFAVLVSTTFAAGLALHGGLQWPQPADLQGLDMFTVLFFKAGPPAKLLTGSPFLARPVLRRHSRLPGWTPARVWNHAAGPGRPLQPAGRIKRARIAKGGTLMPHLEFTLLMAVLLSVVLALLGNRSLRERLYVATYIFLCCALATVAGSWGMYLIHG